VSESIPINSVRVPDGRRVLRNVEQLADSIRELGLLNPITVTPGGVLLTGYHRLEACKLLGWEEIPVCVFEHEGEAEELPLWWELVEIDENLIRNDLELLERCDQESRRKRVYETLHPETKHGGDRRSESSGNHCHLKSFADDTADKTGVTARTVRQEVQIAEKILPEVKAAIRGTELADSKTDLLQLARLPHEKQLRLAQKVVSGEAKSIVDASRLVKREDVAIEPPQSAGKYRVIYADPPWEYSNVGPDYYGPAKRHYPTMSLTDLCALPIEPLAEDNAVLFLWVTSPLLEAAFPVIKAWGFRYKSSFVWDKVKHNFGHYNSVRHELLLIATRGSCLPDAKKLVDSVQTIERSDKHSEKPEEFRQIIDTLYPHGRRIELFARKQVDGWEVWGNECPVSG